MYEGEATAGSLGEQDVVCEKQVTIQPAVAFKHMGLLDGLVVFGQWFCPAKPHNTEDARILDEAAEDPHIIGLLPNIVPIATYVLHCCRLPFGTHGQRERNNLSASRQRRLVGTWIGRGSPDDWGTCATTSLPVIQRTGYLCD